MRFLPEILTLVAMVGVIDASSSSLLSSLHYPRRWGAAAASSTRDVGGAATKICLPPRGGASDEREGGAPAVPPSPAGNVEEEEEDAGEAPSVAATDEDLEAAPPYEAPPSPPASEEAAAVPPPVLVAERSPLPEVTPASAVAAAAPPRGGDHTSSASAALSNLRQRVGPALLMLSAAAAIVRVFGENGIIALVLAIQVGMYHESCSVVESFHRSQRQSEGKGDEGRLERAEQFWERWWWFATVVTATSLRNLVERCAHLSHEAMDLAAYGMAVVGLLSAVVGMATHADAGPEQFRSYLGMVAASHFTLLFLVGQSSFWIKTVHEFGLAWVLFPALLVVVNDTMAYAFGITMGKRKLLPRLSPKKTVEGFIGAALSTVAVAVPLLNFMLSRSGEAAKGAISGDVASHALAMAAFVSLVSPFGGFLASAVKRAHGAKDFGTLIPGHGGVVDRFDCQVVTAPFVYLFLKYKKGS